MERVVSSMPALDAKLIDLADLNPSFSSSSSSKLGSRKSSGTIIGLRDSPYVEIHDEKYDDGGARTMSPRRGSEETEKMGEEARQALVKQAKAINETLLKIRDCVESLKSGYEKLEDGNRFLQGCVGELLETRKSPSPAPRYGP